ncbi:NUDIX hydrolase [Sphingomonas abietis]|uniref:NUDIX hydrolase n=1 Tax=Sphingomonas abietis TaxID=3012344 RepID=A0ABY7NNL0_9SPHN|nr:NUDIX hydrolase [Sphingomonas abietis]WBO22802.1 NUDIX hydrolase [Sphingomonas abietis]
MASTDPAAPVSDAASLILMQDRAGEAPRILIVQRGAALVFAAGAYVFPGGRVDPEDRAAAASAHPQLAPDEAAARIAAIRETREETGIALDPAIGAALIPFARWLPRHEAVKRRFDTRFYLARATGEDIPVADGEETSQAFWATAADVLARCEAGDGRAIFPTRRLLERIARFGSFADACADAARWPQRIISPWIESREDGDWLRIPNDAGYPVTGEPIATAFRY